MLHSVPPPLIEEIENSTCHKHAKEELEYSKAGCALQPALESGLGQAQVLVGMGTGFRGRWHLGHTELL